MRKIITFVTYTLVAFASNLIAGDRPNVLFFLVDDLGWTDLGCYGSKFYETPNVDALAKNGVRFTNAYAACPVCSPTRHSIMSGKYPARSGCTNWGMHMDASEVTIAEALKEGGYSTYFIGKWHLGGKWDGTDPDHTLPQCQGFDVNVGGGVNGQPASYFYPYGDGKRTRRFVVRGLKEGGTKGEYLTDRLGNEAVKLIERHDKKKPFFLYLSFYAVHTPLQGRPDLVAKYKKKVKTMTYSGPEFKQEGAKRMNQWQNSPIYAAMVQAVDENVGKVLKAVEKRDMRKNTIVIFTSDNGGVAYYGSATANLPLRGSKGWLYEGGIREPMIVNWPEKIKPAVCKEPVISTDFYPTILDLVDLPKKPKQHLDGVSFAGLLDGSSGIAPRPLFWHYPHNHGSGSKAAAAIQMGKYKLIEFIAEADKKPELYDLENDLGESRDLAATMPEMVQKLQKQLHDWQEKVNARKYKGRIFRSRK